MLPQTCSGGTFLGMDVWFRYEPDGPMVLQDVTFELRAGQTLGIVGRTGSGKSTLVEMIPRLLEPTPSGTVRVDGRDVRDFPLGVLRAHRGWAPIRPHMPQSASASAPRRSPERKYEP